MTPELDSAEGVTSNPWTTSLDSDHIYEAAWRMPADVERLYRAPLVGGRLRDAAYWNLSVDIVDETVGLVDELPAETTDEDPCAKPHGEWCIVRACWE